MISSNKMFVAGLVVTALGIVILGYFGAENNSFVAKCGFALTVSAAITTAIIGAVCELRENNEM
jgi:hypothetical protein